MDKTGWVATTDKPSYMDPDNPSGAYDVSATVDGVAGVAWGGYYSNPGVAGYHWVLVDLTRPAVVAEVRVWRQYNDHSSSAVFSGGTSSSVGTEDNFNNWATAWTECGTLPAEPMLGTYGRMRSVIQSDTNTLK